jgi:glycosidase
MNRILYASAVAIWWMCCLAFPSLAQHNPKHTSSRKTVMMRKAKTDKLLVYQMMFHLWGNKNTTNKFDGTLEENGVTRFADIDERALTAIRQMGYTHLYLTGILEHATTVDFSQLGIAKDHPINIKGRCGAPFAVKDYYDVNPFYATNPANRMAEFEQMVKRIHVAGLKVIIDNVPNHVARQYRSDNKPAQAEDFGEKDNVNVAFSNQNNFYYLPNTQYNPPKGGNDALLTGDSYVEKPAKATGNDVFSPSPSVDDWFETVKLNYGVDYQNGRQKQFTPLPSTWLKMGQVMKYWAAKGVDGFRCDMAEMVPVEFWNYAITSTKQEFPDMIYIAEIYNPKEYHNYIKNGKFDYLYDKVGLYDALRRLIENKPEATVADITRVWQQESGDISQHMLRFLENHDEQRIASDFFAKDPFKAIPGMVVSATLHTGPLMIYFGQEDGESAMENEGFGKADGRTTMFDFWGVKTHQAWMNGGAFDGGQLSDSQKELRKFYRELMALTQSSEAIQKGAFYDLQYAQNSAFDSRKVYAYLRYSAKEKLLIVCNFDQNQSKTFDLQIPEHAWQALGVANKKSLKMQEIFRDKRQTTLQRSGVRLEMAPNSALVFTLK